MADESQNIDNLGRVINMTMDAFKQMLQDIKGVGPATPTASNPSQEKAMTDLTEALNKFTKDYKKESEKQKKAMKDVVDAMKGVNSARQNRRGGGKGGKTRSGTDKNPAQEEIKDARILEKLHEEMFGKNDTRYKRQFQSVARQAMYERGWNAEQLVFEVKRSQLLQKTIKEQVQYAGAVKSGETAFYALQNQAYKFEDIVTGFTKAFGFDAFATVFTGQIDDAVKFTKEIRNAAYTTMGIGADNKELQKQYEDIGQTVYKTGQSYEKFQKSYVKALRSGINNAKQAQQITTAQLAAETQLGLEAGALEDTFQEMALHNGMNADQIANMGRGMAFVAKETGLSGAAMQKAVEASKQMVNNLRDAGTLTTTAANNLLQLAASAQKYGVEKEISEYANSLSSGYKLFSETNAKTQNLILVAAGKAGATQQAINGTLMSTKDGQKKLAKGMKDILKDYGINDLKEIEGLSAEKKAQINFALEANFGKGLGKFRQEILALEESSMSAGDKMKKYDEQLKSANTTEAEKAQILKKQQQLIKEMGSQGMDALTDAMSKNDNMQDAISKMFQTKEARTEMIKNLQATGSNVTEASSNQEIAAAATKQRVKSLNEELRAAGKAELSISDADIEKALASGNQKAFKEINEQITAAEQVKGTEDVKSVDPYTEKLFKLEQARDAVQEKVRSSLNWFFDSAFGKFVLMAAALAGIAAGGIKTYLKIVEIAKTLRVLYRGKDDTPGAEGKGLFSNLKESAKEKLVNLGVLKPDAPAAGAPAAAAGAAGTAAEAATKAGSGLPEAKAAGAAGTAAEAATKAGSGLPEAKAAEAAAKAGSGTPEAKAAEAAGKAAATSAPDKAMDQQAYRAYRKNEEKKIKADPNLSAKEKKKLIDDLRRGKVEDKIIKQQQKNVKAEAKNIKQEAAQNKAAEQIPEPKMEAAPPQEVGPDLDPNKLKELGGKYAKLAPAIAILAAGALLLGGAIVYLGDKLLTMLGLDVGRIIEVAGALAAIAAVGAAVVVGSVQALKVMSEANTDAFEGKGKELAKKAGKFAAAIAIVAPAMVLVGGVLVWLMGKVVDVLGLDLGRVVEIAGAVVAIAGVTGAMAVGVGEFAEAMDKIEATKFGKVMSNPAKLLKQVAKGALALLAIGGAVIVLGGALVWLGKKVFGALGIDAAAALEVAATFAAVAGAIITIAVAGSLVAGALVLLGLLAPELLAGIALIGIGAVTLLALTAGMILLGAALGAVIKGMFWVLGKIGLDASGLQQAAVDLGEFIGGLVSICLTIAWEGIKLGAAVIAMAVGLAVAVPALIAGAAGVIAFAAGVLVMGVALTLLSVGMMGWNADNLGVLAEGINGFISGVGAVAWAITGNLVTIGLLGLFAPIALVAAAALTAAGVGMLALGVGFILLGVSLGMINAALSAANVDESSGEVLAKFVDNIVNAAWNIAYAVFMNTVRIGKTVFWLSAGAAAIAGLLVVSAAFLVIGPAFASLAEQIINMGKLVTETVSPDVVQQIVTNLDFLLTGTETIAFRIAAFAFKMVVIGALLVAAMATIPVMEFVGEVIFAFQQPIQNLITNIFSLGEIVANTVPLAQAMKIAWDVEMTFLSVSIIAYEFIRASALAGIIAAGMAFGLLMIPVIMFATLAMHAVADALQVFSESALYLGERLAKVITLDEAVEIIFGMRNTYAAAYSISAAFVGMAAKSTLMAFGFALALMTIPAILFATVAMHAVANALQVFSESAVYLGDRLAKVITPDEAEEIITGMKFAYNAAHEMALAFIWMAAKNTLLMFGFALALTTVPVITFGTLAMYVVANALQLFAESAFYLGDMLAKTITPDEAEQIITGMTFAYDAAHQIALTFMGMAARNATLALGFALALMTVPVIMFGTMALWTLYFPLQKFVETARYVAEGLTAAMPAEIAEELTTNLDIAFDAAYHIALSIIDMTKKLVVIGMGAMLAIMAVPFIYAATLSIWALYLPLKSFVEATRFVAEELTAIMPPDLAEELTTNLDIAFDAAYQIALSMIDMSKKLAVIGMGFLVALMAIPVLYAATGTILALFGPLESFLLAVKFTASVLASIFDPEVAEALAETLTSVFDSASAIAWGMVSLGAQMAIIGAGVIAALFAIPLMFAAAKTLELLAWPIQNFIDAAMTQFPADKVEAATDRLDGIVGMFNSLGEFIGGVMTSVANLGILRAFGKLINPSKMADALWSVGETITMGIIDPVLNGMPEMSALDAVITKLDATVQMLTQVQQVMALIGSIMSSISAGIDATAIESLPLEELGQICSRMTGGGKPTIAQGAASGTTMPGTPSEAAIDKRIASEEAFAQERSMKIIDELATAALRGSGILVQAAPAASAETTVATTAAPVAGNAAIETRIAAKKASSKPNMSKVGGKELTDIADSSSEQVELTNKLVQLFQQVVDALKPNSEPNRSGPGEPGNTDPKTIMSKPANYYKSTTGQVLQSPAKAVLNVGPPKTA